VLDRKKENPLLAALSTGIGGTDCLFKTDSLLYRHTKVLS
jgi:hypothetical protein